MGKRSDPEIDFGFHATTPRIIRTGYKNLTATQKWLYVCLKDLCGDHGVCFRTLEVLSRETDISEAMLSKSIYQLRDEGLITAIKKQRSSGGKGVWHISIVDIWGANAKAHPTKHTHKENSQNEDSPKKPQSSQKNIHHMNEKGKENSYGEPEYSQNADRSNNTRSNTITEGEGEGKTPVVSSEQPTQETNSSSSSSMTIEGETHVSLNDEKIQELLSSVVSNLGLPPTQTLIEIILTCHREHPTLDLVVASKEMRTWFTANHPQVVMTEYWFERNLQKKIEFHKKDTQKAKGVGTSISGKPVIRATEEDKLRVPAPRPRRTPTNTSTVFDASKYRQMVACS